jgi:hypothetical protein
MLWSDEAGLGRMALEGEGQRVEEVGALLVEGGEIGAKGAEGFEAGPGYESRRRFSVWNKGTLPFFHRRLFFRLRRRGFGCNFPPNMSLNRNAAILFLLFISRLVGAAPG